MTDDNLITYFEYKNVAEIYFSRYHLRMIKQLTLILATLSLANSAYAHTSTVSSLSQDKSSIEVAFVKSAITLFKSGQHGISVRLVDLSNGPNDNELYLTFYHYGDGEFSTTTAFNLDLPATTLVSARALPSAPDSTPTKYQIKYYDVNGDLKTATVNLTKVIADDQTTKPTGSNQIITYFSSSISLTK
jgi:hypothetical protein